MLERTFAAQRAPLFRYATRLLGDPERARDVVQDTFVKLNLRRPSQPKRRATAANTESYAFQRDNYFLGAGQNPRSTFSIDVDTASYVNVRRFLQAGRLPPADAVRVEGLVNYFPYRYPAPVPDGPNCGATAPFAASMEVTEAPWAPAHRLVRIGLKGREGTTETRPPANLAVKLLVEQVNGTLVTIAKDVKIEVEFNPAKVASYRLTGFENRLLTNEDFNNDQVDAGEIGAGHTVTALYEVVPAGVKDDTPDRSAIDDLKYQGQPASPQLPLAVANEFRTVKVRYKEPTADESRKLEFPLTDTGGSGRRAPT